MCTDDPTVTFSHVELRVSKYSQLRVQARASLVCDESRAERLSAKGFCLLVMAAAVCRARSICVEPRKTKSKSHRSGSNRRPSHYLANALQVRCSTTKLQWQKFSCVVASNRIIYKLCPICPRFVTGTDLPRQRACPSYGAHNANPFQWLICEHNRTPNRQKHPTSNEGNRKKRSLCSLTLSRPMPFAALRAAGLSPRLLSSPAHGIIYQLDKLIDRTTADELFDGLTGVDGPAFQTQVDAFGPQQRQSGVLGRRPLRVLICGSEVAAVKVARVTSSSRGAPSSFHRCQSTWHSVYRVPGQSLSQAWRPHSVASR